AGTGQYRFAVASGASQNADNWLIRETHPTLPRIGTEPGPASLSLLRLRCALHKNSNLGEWRAISTVPRAKRGGGTRHETIIQAES
ncbi:MAG TPA: hypothetical protein VFD63_03155, partial [Pyrinomonadaceae bacterium]|nr:hypothetical protein [Pyrinomonadaceae bacterium]